MLRPLDSPSTSPLADFYSCHPDTELFISNSKIDSSSAIIQRESVGDNGIILSSSPFPVDTSLGRSPRIVFLPYLQTDKFASVCVTAGKNRMLLCHNGLQCELDLSSSESRDRLVLRHGMEICVNHLTAFSIVAPQSTSCCWHDKRIDKRQRWKNSGDVIAKRKVTFSKTICISHLDGTETYKEDDNNEMDSEGEDDAVRQDGEFAIVRGETHKYGLSSVQNELYVLQTGELSYVRTPQAVALIVLAKDVLHFVLPRIAKSVAQIGLRIPAGIEFPIQHGDRLTIQTHIVVEVFVSKLSRALPTSTKSRKAINKSHEIKTLALEVCCESSNSNDGKQQRKTKLVHLPSASTPKFAFWDFVMQRSLAIGKRAGFSNAISLPDRSLAFVQCTIDSEPATEGNNFFTVSPVRDFKDVYQLVGRGETSKRMHPVPLRLGDIFVVGRSVFCIVFQQRGNRLAVPKESAARTVSMLEIELRKSATSQQKLKHAAAGGLFENLVLEEDEDDVEDDPIPSFQDLNSLLEFFDISVDNNVPLMALLALRGPRKNQYYLVNALETTIGASPTATISIGNDRKLSSLHARVYFDESAERWMLEDLESLQGTFCKVGMSDPLLLCCGDVICMGSSTLKVFGSAHSLDDIRSRFALLEMQRQEDAAAATIEEEPAVVVNWETIQDDALAVNKWGWLWALLFAMLTWYALQSIVIGGV